MNTTKIQWKWLFFTCLLFNFSVTSQEGFNNVPQQTILMNFKDVSLDFMLQHLSTKLGLTFIVDDRIKNQEGGLNSKITIINAKAVGMDEAFDILKSILALKEIGLVRQGKIWKVTLLENAIRSKHEVRTNVFNTPDTDNIITQIIPLKFAKAIKLRSIIEGLTSQRGKVAHEDSSNHLVVTDYASNISKLLKIIEALDVPVSKEITQIYFLKYLSVEKLEKIIKSLVPQNNDNVVRIIPASQAKALIVLGSQWVHTRVAELIDKLDTQNVAEEVIIAYPVKYNLVNKLAEVCTGLFTKTSGETKAMFYPDPVTNTLIICAMRETYHQQILPLLGKLDVPTGNAIQSFVYQLSHISAEKLATQLSQIYSHSGGMGGQNQFPIKIAAYKPSNCLMISCTARDYADIIGTIKQLDTHVKQVLIEVIVLEVTLDNDLSLGTEWSIQDSDGDVVLDTDFGLGRKKNINNLPGIRQSVVKNKYQLLANIFATTTEVNVLSAPKIYTANNEDAKIIVGEEVPIIKSRIDSTNINDGITRDFEYREVGLITTITPSINNRNEVAIKVKQEISAIDRFADEPDNTAPIITKREVNTRVKVKSGQTVILGGLYQTRQTDTISKVPVLGDIPVLGLLFSSQQFLSLKTELLIFITANVITDPEEASQVMGIKKSDEDTEQHNRRWQRRRRN